ncbi:MAG: class I SAM-dependent methyltransferase [Candidatus Omnitrophota bacterium]
MKTTETVWDRLYRTQTTVPISKTNRIIFNRVRRHLSFNGKSVLQIGSGPGVFSFLAAQEDPSSITLLDQSEEALRQARSLFSDVRAPVHYCKADILDPSLAIAAHDVVISEGLVEHFRDPELIRVLQRHRDFVKQDGRVLTIVPASPHWNDVRCRAPFSRRCYGWQKPVSKKSMARFFQEAGLDVMVNEKFCSSYGVFHFPGCRYLHRIAAFPIESDHPFDRFFGGLLLTIGRPEGGGR